MARCLLLYNFILQLSLGFFLIRVIASYEEIYLESSKLCTLKDHEEPTIVKLGKDEAKAVVHGHYFDRWQGRYSFSCNFFVQAPSKYGIYAVIQYLNFRRDPISGSCKDYIKLEIPPKYLGFFPKKNVKSFCGNLMPRASLVNFSKDMDYLDVSNHSIISDNGYVAKDGLIYVKIHVARDKLKPDEKLDIGIVFTPYKHDCIKKRDKLFSCRDCEWISEKFVMDKVQNCPYWTCLDEDYCRNVEIKSEIPNILVSSGTGTKVSIGAVATIILVLLVFACCVWVSRRMKLWCFDPTRNRQTRMEMNNSEPVRGAEEINNRYGDLFPETIVPSAPPISDDKDLPPSYSSLFPSK